MQGLDVHFFIWVTFYSCHKYMVLLLVFSPFGRKHIYIIWHFSILKLNCFKKLSSLLRKRFPTFKKLTSHDQDWSYSQIVHHHHRWQPYPVRMFLMILKKIGVIYFQSRLLAFIENTAPGNDSLQICQLGCAVSNNYHCEYSSTSHPMCCEFSWIRNEKCKSNTYLLANYN